MIRIELLIMVLMALFGCGRLRTDPKGDLHRRHGSAKRDDGCKTVDVRAMDFQARVSHVVITSDAGGYATDNRFRCEVDASSDCELWLEVRDVSRPMIYLHSFKTRSVYEEGKKAVHKGVQDGSLRIVHHGSHGSPLRGTRKAV